MPPAAAVPTPTTNSVGPATSNASKRKSWLVGENRSKATAPDASTPPATIIPSAPSCVGDDVDAFLCAVGFGEVGDGGGGDGGGDDGDGGGDDDGSGGG